MTTRTNNILADIDDACTRCGICEYQQSLEGMPVHEVGELAHEIVEAPTFQEISPKAYEFIMACSQCDACTVSCPEDISCGAMVQAARQKLYEFEPDLLSGYRSYRVDYKENVFNAIRDSAGIVYDDVLSEAEPLNKEALTCEKEEGVSDAEVSLFFPGCSLSSYAENLTKATYEYLSERGIVQGLSVHCCGKLLRDIGILETHARYEDDLLAALDKKKVTRLVVACPNCFYEFIALLKRSGRNDIRLETLPEVLKETGMRFNEEEAGSFSFHTSCPDRDDLRFNRSVAGIFEPVTASIHSMESAGRNTICCGAGGLARINAPELAAKRRSRRVQEFEATGADCLVCSCMSCVSTFLSDADAPFTKHYLELLFDIDIDWNQAGENYEKMTQEHEEIYTLPLDQSTPTFAPQGE